MQDKEPRSTLTREYFEKIYRENEDPWSFETSSYEREKYGETIAVLNREKYDHALEIGCSIGIQTSLLAQRCGQVTAVDTSEVALRSARERYGHLENVTFTRMTVPSEFPDGKFDLIVLSEVGYYFTEHDLRQLEAVIREHSEARAQLLLVHWRLFAPDHPVTGDRVHEIFLERPEWRLVRNAGRAEYRIDLLEFYA